MPIKTVVLGPGTLELGEGFDAITSQLRNCRVETAEQVATTEDIPVLSAEVLEGSESVTFTHTLSGRLLQDLDAAGAVAWSWAHRATVQPFTFIPNNAAERQVTGTIKPVPITIGGDVTGNGTPQRPGTPLESDFSWRAKGPGWAGDPVFGDVP